MLALYAPAINRYKTICAYLKKEDIPFDEIEKYLKMSTEDFNKLVREKYEVKGTVDWDAIQKAKKYSSMPDEHTEQVRVVKWCKENKLAHFAVPNGFSTNLGPAYINYMKAEGLKNGAPDLVVFAKQNILFIEMKRQYGGVVSEYQKQWQEFFNKNNFNYFIAEGSDKAIKYIESFLK